VDEFAGITILPSSVVAPNDVAALKHQIKIASKHNRSGRFVAITWNIAHTFDIKNSEIGWEQKA
jgi:hypothetical protein